MGDDPIIRRIEETGYGYEPTEPVCPICGESCDTIYVDKWGNVCGCDECVSARDAWEVAND